MMISKGGINFISRWEGRKSHVYNDIAGLPTIGIGHLLLPHELQSGKVYINKHGFKYRDGLTEKLIDALFQQDSAIAQRAVNETITATLEQHQYDMLVSLAFNIGKSAFEDSTLAKILNRGNYDGVPTQMKRWIYSNGEISQGLINRRNEAAKVWIKHKSVYRKYYKDAIDKLPVAKKEYSHSCEYGDTVHIGKNLQVSANVISNGDTVLTITKKSGI